MWRIQNLYWTVFDLVRAFWEIKKKPAPFSTNKTSIYFCETTFKAHHLTSDGDFLFIFFIYKKSIEISHKDSNIRTYVCVDVCGFCRKPVALSEPAIEALNRTYHSGCFQCRQCHAALAGKTYFNKAGIPLCEDCYQVRTHTHTHNPYLVILNITKIHHQTFTFVDLWPLVTCTEVCVTPSLGAWSDCIDLLK